MPSHFFHFRPYPAIFCAMSSSFLCVCGDDTGSTVERPQEISPAAKSLLRASVRHNREPVSRRGRGPAERYRALSSAEERRPYKAEVAGSKPAAPTREDRTSTASSETHLVFPGRIVGTRWLRDEGARGVQCWR